MKRTLIIAGLAALGISSLTSACDKRSAADGSVALALEGLHGLQARVPAGVRMSKNAVGVGVMLKGPGVSMTIGPKVHSDAENLEEAKKNAESFSPANIEANKLPDGYILTYTNEGRMGTIYWLVGSRLIDGTPYTCGVRSPKKVHQQSAIAICKSLEK